MKLFCTYEKYQRYYRGMIKNISVEGKDSLDCIKKLVDSMTLYLDSNRIEEENLSFEDCLKEIEASTGDGCDMIYILKDDEENIYIENAELSRDDDYEKHDDQDFDDDSDEDFSVRV